MWQAFVPATGLDGKGSRKRRRVGVEADGESASFYENLVLSGILLLLYIQQCTK